MCLWIIFPIIGGISTGNGPQSINIKWWSTSTMSHYRINQEHLEPFFRCLSLYSIKQSGGWLQTNEQDCLGTKKLIEVSPLGIRISRTMDNNLLLVWPIPYHDGITIYSGFSKSNHSRLQDNDNHFLSLLVF